MTTTTDAPPARPTKRKREVIPVIAIVIVVILLSWLIRLWINNSASRRTAAATDAAIVAEVEQFVITTFTAKGPDDPLIRRLGQFQRLVGSGFDRPTYAWQLVERVEFFRTAVFSKGSVPVSVFIQATGPFEMHLEIYPSDEWLAQHPEASEISPDAQWLADHPQEAKIGTPGNMLVTSTGPSGTSGTTIGIYITHPQFNVQ